MYLYDQFYQFMQHSPLLGAVIFSVVLVQVLKWRVYLKSIHQAALQRSLAERADEIFNPVYPRIAPQIEEIAQPYREPPVRVLERARIYEQAEAELADDLASWFRVMCYDYMMRRLPCGWPAIGCTCAEQQRRFLRQDIMHLTTDRRFIQQRRVVITVLGLREELTNEPAPSVDGEEGTAAPEFTPKDGIVGSDLVSTVGELRRD